MPANTAYNLIPLATLDVARTTLNAMLKLRSKEDGVRYGIRTFYLGPRDKASYGSYPGQTLKSQARAAKIGVYRFELDRHSGRFVPAELLYYV
jgi:hypothetical protein